MRGARRPDADYPFMAQKGYAEAYRQRAAYDDPVRDRRNGAISRLMAVARKEDTAGMDELVRRISRMGGWNS